VEVIREVRSQVGPEFPICLRYSQWKQQDYNAKLAHIPAELERFLAPLTGAGVDLFSLFAAPLLGGLNLRAVR